MMLQVAIGKCKVCNSCPDRSTDYWTV